MLKTIIAREFLNNILNLRFIVGLVLCVIITIACVIILTHDYQQEANDHSLRIRLQDEFLSKYAHRNRMGGMITLQKPPERFRPLIIGVPRDADMGSFDDNPLRLLFPPLDFLFKLKKDLYTKVTAQNKIAKNLTCISPYANFVYVATDLTGTGLRGLDHFERADKEYGVAVGTTVALRAPSVPTAVTNSDESTLKQPVFCLVNGYRPTKDVCVSPWKNGQYCQLTFNGNGAASLE